MFMNRAVLPLEYDLNKQRNPMLQTLIQLFATTQLLHPEEKQLEGKQQPPILLVLLF